MATVSSISTAVIFSSAAALSNAAALLTTALSPDCVVAGNSLQCRLDNFLNLLYVVAAVLAFVLAVVLILAWRSWHQNRKVEPRREEPRS